MTDINLNLSGWIERRELDVGPCADVVIKHVKQYEAEIDRLRDRVLALVEALTDIDGNLTHFLKRSPQQVMLPETVEFVRDMARAALAPQETPP